MENALMTLNTAPVHPHATWVALNPALQLKMHQLFVSDSKQQKICIAF